MFSKFKSENDGRRLTFDIADVDVSVVNAIRRVVTAEIPNMAIAFDPYNPKNSDIVFTANTSAINNEILGLRISLVPVQYEQEDIDNPVNYKFRIKKKNTGSDAIDITTNDIQGYDEDGDPIPVKRMQSIFPVDAFTKDPIILTRLKPNMYNSDLGEELDVEFGARIGIAVDHARWSPISQCAYFNTVDEAAADEAFKNRTNKQQTRKDFNVLDRDRCYLKNAFDEPNKFTFTIESECRLTPTYLFSKAIDVLVGKLDTLTQQPNKYTVETLGNMNMFAVTITKENHTIGNLLQAQVYNLMRGKGVDYIGYTLPHPLEDDIVVKVKLDTDVYPDVDAMFYDAIPKITHLLKNIQLEWARSTNQPSKPIVKKTK